jgi:hypothetical protein
MITIAMTSRTGSTMLAQIFKAHGLRTGDDHPKIEHQGIQQWVKARFHQTWRNPHNVPSWMVRDFQYYLRNLNIELWKGDLYWWPLFERSSSRSVQAKNYTAFDVPLEDIIAARKIREKRMDELIETYGGVNVYTEDLIHGDLSSLEIAFDYCGLKFNPEIANQIIDPQQWHY